MTRSIHKTVNLRRLFPAVFLSLCFFVLGCGEKKKPEPTDARSSDPDSTPTDTRGFTAFAGDKVKVGKRVAIVIGNDIYDGLDGANLEVAVKDARLMAETLRSLDPPFLVTLLENATQRESEDALENFIDSALHAECALFYFAGHGIEYHGSNFLIARDSEIDRATADVRRMKRILGNEALEMQSVVDDLEATEAGVKVVILDACRDNPVEVVAAGPGGQRSVLSGEDGGLAQVAAPSGMYVSYAADASQQANDGLFTRVLCSQMQREGVDIVRVFAATREEVLRESRRMNRENPKRWVVHEPAEYNKLNEAGTRFRFNGGLSETEKRLAAFEAELAEKDRLLKELRTAQAVKAEKVGPAPDSPPVPEHEPEPKPEPAVKVGRIDPPIPEPKSLPGPSRPISPTMSKGNAFPAGTRSMEGSKAGETRSFGGIEFVWCPPTGEEGFLMGSPESEEDRGSDEKQHRVTLTKGFWMAKTECTQGQWESAMGSNPSEFVGTERPVEQVSWEDCQVWLEKMNREHLLPEGWKWVLPSEAQWEYACRAGTETAYVFGDDDSELHKYGNFADRNFTERDWGDGTQNDGVGNETAEVSSYLPNAWGLLDMHGNVYEWCADRYGKDYYSEGQRDPVGPTDGSYRVGRGGSWFRSGHVCRSAFREWYTPAYRKNFLGFRPVVSRNPTSALPESQLATDVESQVTALMPVTSSEIFPAGTRSMEGSKAGEARNFGGIEFVWCPPTGEKGFQMGSPESEADREDSEKQHRVVLTKGFWMAKTECTQGQWESVMGSNPSEFDGSKKLPVERVSWEDCQEWLEKMNEKHALPEGWKWVLPSEAQWEYACRAGTETAFAFGDSLNSKQANFDGDYPYGGAAKGPSLGETSEVGSYEANEWGLLDMHGNVYEWSADWYDGDYYSEGQSDPEDPNGGSYRVYRGGCWSSDAKFCRSANRDRATPGDRYYDLGFRPAVSSAR